MRQGLTPFLYWHNFVILLRVSTANNIFFRYTRSIFLPNQRANVFRGQNFKGAFTLIELLVVIAILGILAAAVLVAINPGKRTRQAQDAKRKNDIGALATEVQAYYTHPGNGNYPTSLGVLTAGSYLKQMPLDPTATGGAGCCAYGYSVNAAPDVAVWATLAEPTSGANPSYLWCYRSVNGKAQEVLTAAGGACLP